MDSRGCAPEPIPKSPATIGALEKLPPESQEAVRLARLEGLRIREIAERLGKSEAAVKSILFRAVRALRETMGDTESFRLPNRWLGREAGEDADGERVNERTP